MGGEEDRGRSGSADDDSKVHSSKPVAAGIETKDKETLAKGEGDTNARHDQGHDLPATQKTPNVSEKDSGNEDNERRPTSPHDKAKVVEMNEARAPQSPTKKKSVHKHHYHHHHHHSLDEGTLKRLKAHLESDKLKESLDEDAIAVKILRTNRMTNDRLRQFLPYSDSEEDGEDANRRQVTYDSMEDYTLSLDFFKKVIADTQEENLQVPVDKRTINWLRKSVGLQRRSDVLDGTGHGSDDSDEESASKPQRVTRGVTRNTRSQKRQERVSREKMGLDALALAVADLEEELGPFPDAKSKKRKRDEKRASDAFEEKRRPKHNPKREKRVLAYEKVDYNRQLVAHLPEGKQLLTKSGRPIRRVNRGQRLANVRVNVEGKNVAEVMKARRQEKTAERMKRKRESPSLSEGERRRKKATLSKKHEKAIADVKKASEGRLFSEMDPFGAMKMDASDYVAESDYISLGLLDWKRRQQWHTKSTKNGKEEAPLERMQYQPHKLEANGIIETLPPWNVVNPIPGIKRRPATSEPPRRRHSDAKYAEWSTMMINCLKGSGRSWAFYEFFYSDIDRAWYNFDDFKVDIAKIGVPPDVKLTRKEWSLVRRCIPRRPRRFSKSFIRSQMLQLNKYRHLVRRIQHDPDDLKCKIGYDVPAYIKVGASVTAFHSRFRVLHRGIVVAHDSLRHGYLIQFERQELGYQFCADVCVASHGVPAILVRATDVALDGSVLGPLGDRNSAPGNLACGTSYGPMYLDQPDPVKKDREERNALLDAVMGSERQNAAFTRRDPIVAGEYLVTMSTLGLESGAGPSVSDRVELIEAVAERETLIQLIRNIATAMTRKRTILDAIDECHKMLDTKMRDENRPFKDHYTWLQANLVITNQNLESSLLLLQAMYSKAYTGMRADEIQNEKKLALDQKLRQLIKADQVSQVVTAPWSAAMVHGSGKISSLFERHENSYQMRPLENERFAPNRNATLDAETLRMQYLDKRLAVACRLLLDTNYCSALVRSDQSELDFGSMLSVGPMNDLLQAELHALEQKPLPQSNGAASGEKLDGADALRFSAMKELREALSYFKTELQALHIAKKVVHNEK